jgi:hypothetical protein
MITSTPLHNKAHRIPPRGELVMIGIDRVVVGRESLFTNLEVIYDLVAPMSKRTKAVAPQTKKITDHDVRSVSSLLLVRWFSLPRPAVSGGAA